MADNEITEPTEGEKLDALIENFDPELALPREQRIWVKDMIVDPAYGPINWDETYTQRPLSGLPKMQYMRMISQRFDKLMNPDDGSNPVTVAEILGITRFNMETFQGADALTTTVFRIMEFSPEIVEDSLMISWNVPRGSREVVRAILNQPTFEDGSGGLTDDEFEQAIICFIAQNAGPIRNFLSERLSRVGRAFAALSRDTEADEKESKVPSGGSKRTKPTARATRKK